MTTLFRKFPLLCLSNPFNQVSSVCHWGAFITRDRMTEREKANMENKLFWILFFSFSVVHTAARSIHCSQWSETPDKYFMISQGRSSLQPIQKNKKNRASPPTRVLRPCIIHISSGYGSLLNFSFAHSLSVLMVEQLQQSSPRQAIRYRCLRGTTLTSFQSSSYLYPSDN